MVAAALQLAEQGLLAGELPIGGGAEQGGAQQGEDDAGELDAGGPGAF
jgi:hypothetical protein